MHYNPLVTAPTSATSSVLHLKVVLDTNAIYTASSGYLLSYEAATLIREVRGDEHLRVSWYLPQIVVDERRYQIEREALHLHRSLAKLEKIIRHNVGLDESVLLDRIAASVSKQLEEIGLSVCGADPAHIDWARMVRDAVTRRPPFDPAPEVEKGFRDALILEALKQLVHSSLPEEIACRFAFVTRDGLLATATRDSALPKLHVFESVDGVRGLINVLLSTNLTEESVARWQATAKEYFYNQETGAGVFGELAVASRIRKECRAALSELPAGAHRRQNEWKWLIAGLVSSERFTRGCCGQAG